MKQQTNESPGYAACMAMAEPLTIPRLGGRMIGRVKRGETLRFIRQKVCCDFAGTIRGTGEGRLLLVDFKRCEVRDVFPVNDSTVKPHQIDELVRHGRQNALAGLLIEAAAHERFYWCSWTALASTNRCTRIRYSVMRDLGQSNVVPDLRKVIKEIP